MKYTLNALYCDTLNNIPRLAEATTYNTTTTTTALQILSIYTIPCKKIGILATGCRRCGVKNDVKFPKTGPHSKKIRLVCLSPLFRFFQVWYIWIYIYIYIYVYTIWLPEHWMFGWVPRRSRDYTGDGNCQTTCLLHCSSPRGQVSLDRITSCKTRTIVPLTASGVPRLGVTR